MSRQRTHANLAARPDHGPGPGRDRIDRAATAVPAPALAAPVPVAIRRVRDRAPAGAAADRDRTAVLPALDPERHRRVVPSHGRHLYRAVLGRQVSSIDAGSPVRERRVNRAVVPAVVALALAPDRAADRVDPIAPAEGVADDRSQDLSSERQPPPPNSVVRSKVLLEPNFQRRFML